MSLNSKLQITNDKQIPNHKFQTLKYYFLLFFFFFSVTAFSQDEAQKNESNAPATKNVENIIFRVPQDRPVERKNGVIQVMSMDDYYAKKFAQLEYRFALLEQKINQMQEEIKQIKEK